MSTLTRFVRLDTAAVWFFLLLFAVYTATAHYGGTVVNDVHSAAHAAWSLATRGTLDLSGLDNANEQAWTVEVGDALYSNRFPGVILAGAPFYLLLAPEDPAVLPSALAAAFCSAAGVTGVLVGLRRLVPLWWAWGSTVALALGSGVWSVGADGLWTHGVTTMYLGLAFAALTLAGRWRWLVVLPAAGAVLTRPQLGVALGIAALVLLLTGSQRARALALGGGAVLGGAAFLVYGRLIFGEWSLTGTYDREILSPGYIGELNRDERDGAALWRLENLAMAFVAPRVGLLPAYPALLVALWSSRRRWRLLPAVPRALGVAAVVYLLASISLNRVSGGNAFWGNRTLIESVVLAWPLLTWAVAQHQGNRVWRLLLATALAWSVFFHSLGALTPSPAPSAPASSVLFWQVPQGVLAAGWWQLAAVGVLTAVAWVATWRLSRSGGNPGTSSGGIPQRAGRCDSTDATTSDADSTSASSTSR